MEDASRSGLQRHKDIKEEISDLPDIKHKIGNKRTYEESNEENNQSSPKHKHISSTKQEAFVENSNMGSDHTIASSSSSLKKDQIDLESARVEMGEVREENKRLKMHLDRIMKDYKTLQMQFYDIVQQDTNKPSQPTQSSNEMVEEPCDDLVSLSLGRSSSDSKKEEKNKTLCHQPKDLEGLSLGLDCKFDTSKSSEATDPLPNPNTSPENSSEEVKEEAGETWPPSKVLKMMKSSDHEEILQQNSVKKARVSVRARCDTPTMNDGCQWRKYGQKIAKGNPCPRAYYRCTVAPSCPVRKQVQRCAEDMSILITTYEGNHNHPLPVSATAMASTTSAAASMLLSGSSSTTHPGSSSTFTTLHGLNFYLSDSSKSKQFYLPNSSLTAPSHPTITLDLTTPPQPPHSSATATATSSSSHFNRFTHNPYPPNPRYLNSNSTTSLNFGSSESNTPISWSNWKNPNPNLNLTRPQQHSQHPLIDNIIYQSYIQKNTPTNPNPNTTSSSSDPIAAATKAITSDPSFQSALAAALSSIIGANQTNSGDAFGQKMNQFSFSSTQGVVSKAGNSNNIGCGSSFLNKSSTTTATTNSQPGSLVFQQPASLPILNSKSSNSSSPRDKEHSH